MRAHSTAVADALRAHERAGTEGCWLWDGLLRPNGYGQVKRDGRTTSTHRVAWELTYGPIPPGLVVAHRCNVKRCIRPDHLYLTTFAQNSTDAARDGLYPTGTRNGMHTHPESRLRGDAHPTHLHPEVMPRGSRNPNARLDEATVRRIKALLAARDVVNARVPKGSRYSYASIGERFGVHKNTVRLIAAGRIWAHLV